MGLGGVANAESILTAPSYWVRILNIWTKNNSVFLKIFEKITNKVKSTKIKVFEQSHFEKKRNLWEYSDKAWLNRWEIQTLRHFSNLSFLNRLKKTHNKRNILKIKNIWAVAFGRKIFRLDFLRVSSQCTTTRLRILMLFCCFFF